MSLLAIFCCGVSYGDGNCDGSCRCKSLGALFVGVVDTGVGMVGRWADVEVVVRVVVVRGPIDKYRYATGCDITRYSLK